MIANSANKDRSIPLVAHVVHRFDYGGLENGLVNVINEMDGSAFRHAVIALTEFTEFANRISNTRTSVHSLHKQPGKDPRAYARLWSLLRELRPDILHTRNIGTMDCVVIGRLAGVPVCIHGEHGWDTHDTDGVNSKYRLFRRVFNPMVNHYMTVSEDLAMWLVNWVGISPNKISTICNGVDTQKFRPAENDLRQSLPPELRGPAIVIAGSVTRFAEIKDPMNLLRAFAIARESLINRGVDLRLVMLGDGELKPAAERFLLQNELSQFSWMPGMRDDTPELLPCFDMFILSSKREGISNTILEALASGLPVIATRTGGNPELLDGHGVGSLVATEAPGELADAIASYAVNAGRRAAEGHLARQRALSHHSLNIMAENYRQMYSSFLD